MDQGLIPTASSPGKVCHSQCAIPPSSSELSKAMPVGTEPGWECRSPTRGFDEVSLLFEKRKYLRALPEVVGIPTWPEGVSHPTASPQDMPDFPAATGCPTQPFISRQACPGRTAAECLITRLFFFFFLFFLLITTMQRGASSLYFHRGRGEILLI